MKFINKNLIIWDNFLKKNDQKKIKNTIVILLTILAKVSSNGRLFQMNPWKMMDWSLIWPSHLAPSLLLFLIWLYQLHCKPEEIARMPLLTFLLWKVREAIPLLNRNIIKITVTVIEPPTKFLFSSPIRKIGLARITLKEIIYHRDYLLVGTLTFRGNGIIEETLEITIRGNGTTGEILETL